MRGSLCLLILLVPFALAVPAETYASDDDCVLLGRPEVGPLCRVEQEGTLWVGGCDASRCDIGTDARYHGEGIPSAWTLMGALRRASGPPTVEVCASYVTGTTLACEGSATMRVSLPPGSCTSVWTYGLLYAGIEPILGRSTVVRYDAVRDSDGTATLVPGDECEKI